PPARAPHPRPRAAVLAGAAADPRRRTAYRHDLAPHRHRARPHPRRHPHRHRRHRRAHHPADHHPGRHPALLPGHPPAPPPPPQPSKTGTTPELSAGGGITTKAKSFTTRPDPTRPSSTKDAGTTPCDLHERHLAAHRSEEVQYATRGFIRGACIEERRTLTPA